MKSLLVLLCIMTVCCAGLAHAAKPVRVGVLYGQAVTTVKSYVSSEDERGALLAAEDINNRGGILGRPVELEIARVTTPLEGKKLARELTSSDIIAAVGANTSSLTMALAQVFQEAGVPLISPIATHPKVTEIGDFIFRACFTDDLQGSFMARHALNDLNAKRAVILTKADSQFSLSLSERFAAAFSKGGEVAWQGQYLTRDVDFEALLRKVMDIAPDVVFVPGHGRDSGMVMKQGHAMGVKAVFLGGDGWGKGALGVAGAAAAENGRFVNHWHMNVETPGSKRFVERYREKFGDKVIASSAPLAYDALMLIASAAERAQSLDREAIRDAMADAPPHKGVTGVIRFDSRGNPVGKRAVILKYENGGIVFLKSFQP